MTQSKTIQQAIDKQIDRQRRQLDHAHGLKTVKVMLRFDQKTGRVVETLIVPETSSEWGEDSKRAGAGLC